MRKYSYAADQSALGAAAAVSTLNKPAVASRCCCSMLLNGSAASTGCATMLAVQEWDVLAEVSVPAPTQASGAISEPQLREATLTWRGDSKFFASNTLWEVQSSDSSITSGTAAVHTRLLHIWDREDCKLHATGEPAAGLAAPIAWQPNSRHLYAAAAAAAAPQTGPRDAAAATASAGFNSKGQPLKAAPHQGGGAATTLAGTKGLKQRQQLSAAQGSSADAVGDGWMQHVLLYERNGLQHGGFDVPTYSNSSRPDTASGLADSSSKQSELVIQALHWSIDSELLAVVLAPADVGQQQISVAEESSSKTTHEWHVQVSLQGSTHTIY